MASKSSDKVSSSGISSQLEAKDRRIKNSKASGSGRTNKSIESPPVSPKKAKAKWDDEVSDCSDASHDSDVDSQDESEANVVLETDLPDLPKPSTMVVIAKLSTEINLTVAFWCLPVATSESELPYEAPKRARFKRVGEAGTIISLRYENMHRGLDKGGKPRKKDLENNIEIDISVTGKNVNLRLSKDGIHMTGVNSPEMSNEVVELMTQHLTKINDDLAFLDTNVTLVQEFLFRVKGKPVWDRGRLRHKLQHIEDYEPSLEVLLRCWQQLKIYEDLERFFRYLFFRLPIISSPCGCLGTYDAVANYNYKIGHPINKAALAGQKKLARDYGFFVSYNSSSSKDVILMMKPKAEDIASRSVFRKSTKPPMHNFRIKSSGSVKQSSPSHPSGCRAYLIFRAFIEEVLDQIIDK